MRRNYDYERITFTNQNFNFEFFYKQMENTISELSNELDLFKCNKILSSFIGNFFYGVVLEDYREKITDIKIKLNNEINSDKEIDKILKYSNQGINMAMEYTQKYFYYYNKIMSLFGLFLESLDQSLMPNTYKSKKKVRYSNNLYFFTTYSKVKMIISENLSSFNIKKFIVPINSIITFYYAYKSYITESSRQNIEKSINLLITFVSEKDFLNVLKKEHKTTNEINILSEINNRLYSILLHIYSEINEQHSLYDLNPKIEKNVYIDKTGM